MPGNKCLAIYGGGVTESSVKIRIQGSKGRIENGLKKKGMAKIRACVATHVTDYPRPGNPPE